MVCKSRLRSSTLVRREHLVARSAGMSLWCLLRSPWGILLHRDLKSVPCNNKLPGTPCNLVDINTKWNPCLSVVQRKDTLVDIINVHFCEYRSPKTQPFQAQISCIVFQRNSDLRAFFQHSWMMPDKIDRSSDRKLDNIILLEFG